MSLPKVLLLVGSAILLLAVAVVAVPLLLQQRGEAQERERTEQVRQQTRQQAVDSCRSLLERVDRTSSDTLALADSNLRRTIAECRRLVG